ncbi:MAG: hypothetical protein UV09_C0015G0006 [Candidatus Gottesmanbacteria bacterium GW2011_GWA2_42_18]|uniref:5-formaminoimidazole-4-carboxamide-1-(Beta)-D-ribofuranosyl 5'-monophosphate synthetase n=1 Tax=Candidatus Gottesmanbacteria bacterium GW2011_GWA2_42_18 TaxID=1618442 RepID=A0A0G0ZDA4_9BACT|nr:MAG: hypothetical protein UV09_C0015G0006 [Candidatus Gottesmanbacteria bacterium GW2011_GWA2_42_18]
MTKPIIATLAGHSALEIFTAAKKGKFETLALVVAGRERTYSHYYRHLIDKLITLRHFSQLTDPATRGMFPEEREGRYNQYQILKKSGIEYPKQFKEPKEIDRLVLVKVREKIRRYERAFFFAANQAEFYNEGQKLIRIGRITESDLKEAVIEEFILGPQVNFNFFYSPLEKRLELLGTDTRRQTNLDGLIRLPSVWQIKFLEKNNPSYIESGHISVTVKESLLEKAFAAAEKILKAAREISPPGIIGPFALQTAVTAGPPSEKIITFDLSLRIPGSPGTAFTPYSSYLFGRNMTCGERIVMEIEKALKLKSLPKITS